MFINIIVQIERDGYVVIEDFLRADEIEELKAQGEAFTDNLPEESKRKIFNTIDPKQVND